MLRYVKYANAYLHAYTIQKTACYIGLYYILCSFFICRLHNIKKIVCSDFFI